MRSSAARERLSWLEERLARAEPLAEESERLRSELHAERVRREADAERLAWIHTADEQLKVSFQALASQLLRRGSEDLVDRSREELRGVVEPLSRLLQGLDQQVRQLEKDRQGAYSGLRQELEHLRRAQNELHGTARGLERALRSSGARGRWGEVQLRRLVELAGMVEHVDFREQSAVEGGNRPDLVVHLPGGGTLAIDAKAPLASYLQAVEAGDTDARRQHLEAHLKALKQRALELSRRDYAGSLPESPDFVVMFLPHEGSLASAFERDPELLDFCTDRRVLPATPITLLALLKSVAWGWRQERVAEGAARIAEAGRELHRRLGTFLDHLRNLGKGLDGSVSAYNRAVGSLERRVLPAIRRLEDAAAIEPPAEAPSPSRLAARPTAGDASSEDRRG